MRNIFDSFILISSILLINTSVTGQSLQSIGIKTGVAVSNQTWEYIAIEEEINKNYLCGFYTAVSAEFFNFKYACLLLDAGYCRKGSTEKIEITTNDIPEGTGEFTNYDTKINFRMPRI